MSFHDDYGVEKKPKPKPKPKPVLHPSEEPGYYGDEYAPSYVGDLRGKPIDDD